ncbi:hypothetical protein FRC06_008515, partial [Ceratobasidium sp. 370]
EKAHLSASPSPPAGAQEDTVLCPPITAIAVGNNKNADRDTEEEVDQIVDMASPATTRPRQSLDTATAPPAVCTGSAGARSNSAVKDLKKDAKDGNDTKDPKGAKTNGANGAATHDEDLDAEGSPEADTDELSVDEELLKLSTHSRHPPHEDYIREDYREYRGPNASGANGDPTGSGRRGWGHREQQDAEPTLSPIQSSFPRAQATSPYPPPPSMPQMSPNHIHAARPVQPTATLLPPLAPMRNTLPSIRQSYPPLVPSYLSTPHPGPEQAPYAQPPPPPYPMQHPAYGPPPHGYPQQPTMPRSMPPPPQPGSWDHYAPSNNGREPRP